MVYVMSSRAMAGVSAKVKNSGAERVDESRRVMVALRFTGGGRGRMQRRTQICWQRQRGCPDGMTDCYTICMSARFSVSNKQSKKKQAIAGSDAMHWTHLPRPKKPIHAGLHAISPHSSGPQSPVAAMAHAKPAARRPLSPSCSHNRSA